tara:strand:+ start:44 stop:730 length:687 start_codon:yes stop_codon:yes gene_type:complete
MRRRKRRRRSFSIASLKIHRHKQCFNTKSGSSFDDVNDVIKNEEEDAFDDEAFLESGFEFSLECVFSKASTPSVAEEEDDEEEEEEEEEFAVRLSYAFDISNALVRSRLGTMMITNDKSEENNNKDKDKEVLKTMVFTLKEERFTYEQKGNNDNGITLSVDAREMQKILERVPLRVKENTACVFVETMKREDDNSKKYIVDDRLTVVAKHFRCEETGKLKRQFVNPFV